jgi:hypothetical protein
MACQDGPHGLRRIEGPRSDAMAPVSASAGSFRTRGELLFRGAVVDPGDANHDCLAQQRGQGGGAIRSLWI